MRLGPVSLRCLAAAMLAALVLVLPGCAAPETYSAGPAAPRVLAANASPNDSDGPHLLFAGFRLVEPPHMVMLTSRDGLAWRPVRAGLPMLRTDLGIRDPHIARGPNGVYHCVWTTRVADGIGYASSRDLIAWTEPRVLRVMQPVAKTWNCWAPELVWLEDRGEWMIHFASTIVGLRDPATAGGEKLNHRIYRVTTRDFRTLSTPEVLYDPGYTVIDATIFETGSGRWAMAVKDERLEPVEKRVRLAYANHPLGPWSPPSDPISPSWREGPTLARFAGWWWMYVDRYRSNRYELLRSRDLSVWERVRPRPDLLPGFRHGCVITVPPAVFEGLESLRPAGGVTPVSRSSENLAAAMP